MSGGFTMGVEAAEARVLLLNIASRINSIGPVMQTIGEDILERTKHRFDTSTDPEGKPWKPNSASTLAMLSGRLAGVKSNVKKNGSLNAKGQRALASKKPLIGESQDLRRQFTISVAGNVLTIGSTPLYAAIQQFGGRAGHGLAVTIPARPFLPVRPDGSIYPKDNALILQALNAHLAQKR